VLRQHLDHDVGGVFDVQVAGAESERCDGELANLKRNRALQRAHERETNRRPAHRLIVAGHDAVNEELDREVAGIRDDRRTDGQRLGKPCVPAACSRRRMTGVVAPSMAFTGRAIASPS
jgi:hypothetical protein